jgi:hypothetical protein
MVMMKVYMKPLVKSERISIEREKLKKELMLYPRKFNHL